VRYPNFETRTRSLTLPCPTSAAPAISRCARSLVRRTDAQSRAVRLLGVGASNLVPHDHEQLSLFESA
jgi:hypothetical protein